MRVEIARASHEKGRGDNVRVSQGVRVTVLDVQLLRQPPTSPRGERVRVLEDAVEVEHHPAEVGRMGSAVLDQRLARCTNADRDIPVGGFGLGWSQLRYLDAWSHRDVGDLLFDRAAAALPVNVFPRESEWGRTHARAPRRSPVYRPPLCVGRRAVDATSPAAEMSAVHGGR